MTETEWHPVAEKAEEQAKRLVDLFYDPAAFLKGLVAAVSVPLLKEFISGSSAELAYHQFILQKKSGPLTTAEEYAIRNNIDLGELTEFIEEFQIGLRLPDWMLEKGIEALGESVSKPYWKDIGDTFGSDAASILRDSIERGWSIDRIAKELRGQTGDPDSAWAKTRAKNIARTECLTADTQLDGANITAAYKRWYDGEIIEVVTETGCKFTGTPNHPMLTDRGWIALNELSEGDNLLRYKADIESPGPACDEYIEAPPPAIGEIFDSLAAVFISSRRRGRQPDFHGDGMDGDIDILCIDRILAMGVFLPITEGLIENILTPSCVEKVLRDTQCVPFAAGTFHRLGSTYFGGCTKSNAHNGKGSIYTGLCYANCPSDLSTVHPAKVHSPDAAVRKATFSTPGLPSFGHRQTFGLSRGPADTSSFNTAFDQRLIDSHVFRNFTAAKTGCVKTEKVSQLRRINHWSGHVFNLTTDCGYFTIAGGLYTGNTGHMMNSGHSAGIDQVNEELGEDLFGKEWLSVLGSTTRESHAAMNGQIADKDGMFDLEGYLVPWPSHIDLPPSLRCNCQCSIISSGLEKEIEDNPAPAIDEQADDEEPPPSKAILENMTADEIANTHPVLKEQHEKFVAETEEFSKRIEKVREEAVALEMQQKPIYESWANADGELRAAIAAGQPEDVVVGLREKLQQIAEQHDELTKRIVATGDRVEGIRAESLAEFVKRFGAEAPAEFELRKGKRTEEVIDGARASTGNPLRRFQDATKEAGDFVRNLVNTGMDSESQHALLDVDIHQGSPKLRAFYRETGSPGKPAGVYAGSKDPPKTIVHELGHHLENRVQGIRDRANQFLDYRLSQSGTESKSMSEISSFYRKDETGNDDDFWRMFTDSKTKPEKPIESAYYVGKRYKSGDTEIVSMGLEQLYRDPARFARRDPEYFRFLTGILNGSIR